MTSMRHLLLRAITPTVSRVRDVADGLLAERHFASLSSVCMQDDNVTLYRDTTILNLMNSQSRIKIGPHAHVRGELVIYPPNGRISIGEWTFIGRNTRIWSADGIEIGKRVAISYNVSIHDFN